MYRLPRFNLSIGLWYATGTYPIGPDLAFNANLSPGRRHTQAAPAVTGANVGNPLTPFVEFSELLCPALTDIRGVQTNGPDSWVEVPIGSGRCYLVTWVEDVAKGFANEYRLALLVQMNFAVAASLIWNQPGMPVWPVPTP